MPRGREKSLAPVAITHPTQGPLAVVSRNPHEYDIDAPCGEHRLGYDKWDALATVYGSDDNMEIGDAVALANATLFAAAFDLLQACVNASWLLDDLAHPPMTTGVADTRKKILLVVRQLDAAIEKAAPYREDARG